ncbi:hypothetical protein E2C01_006168 [Portunus trituberculatus]|uniref:Uncharacterized protein n=1 Tax=Portunus trituberculatus TaxID=210409 RepID=A0A5B7D123_PORTR|nr:hypothetical protein [Portunus trituberculatus]
MVVVIANSLMYTVVVNGRLREDEKEEEEEEVELEEEEENGNYSTRSRNNIGYMAPLGLTGKRYTSHWATKFGRIRTQAALTNYATQPPRRRLVMRGSGVTQAAPAGRRLKAGWLRRDPSERKN